jgi:hypothetical protein
VKQALLHFGPFDVLRACPGEFPCKLACSTGLRAEGVAGCRRRPGLLPPLSSRRLRELGRRVYDLTAPINDVDKHLDGSALLHRTPSLCPKLAPSVPPNCSSQPTETSAASATRPPSGGLCGVAPLRASSGKSHRMRLHQRGNRRTNRGTKLPSVVSYASSPASFVRR